mmetsp:Transcript_83552/g.180255  ORF Transcript_83552/g.180255 Transcript_83552/m.180255 type:complete len:302 (+) Transcript_83552:1634-2539(+)
MMASVSIQLARFEDATSCSKSFVMMLPTVVRKWSPCRRRYSSRALVQRVVPPPEARRRPSAMRPLLKQHSTAAVRLPTSRDCLMRASGPADQSFSFLVLASCSACSFSADCRAATAAASSASFSAFSFCSVLAASCSKKSSANSSSTGAKEAGVGEAFAEGTFSSSGGGPMSVIPGRFPRKRSASCRMLSWSKPSSVGTFWRPPSSNCEPIRSHIKPSCEFAPPDRRVLSWQYSRSLRSAIHCSNASASLTISGSLGTTSECAKDASFASCPAGTFFAPKDTIFPPKPKEDPHGRRYHLGQ